jgi:anaerobic magnesium-protoporphyrin IX monomethyl ester cyclase
MMKRIIDCVFIGHNQIDLAKYEKIVRGMGTDSGFYRDLNLNFIWYDNKPYSAADIFNLFFTSADAPGGNQKPLSVGETFSSAVAYLATYLCRRGFTFDFVNSFQDEKGQLRRILEEDDVLSAAIVTTYYVSAFPIMEIVDFIRKHNKEVKIIVGGPFIFNYVRHQDAASLEHLFENEINADIYINSAQGETALVETIKALKEGLPLDNIKNIYFRKGGGYQANPTTIEENILSENLVNWNLFADRIGDSVNVRTTISCPFSCAFCGYPEYAGKYQFLKAEEIMEELNQLNRMPALKRVNFIDDTFNIPGKRYKEVLRMMIDSKLKFKWISNFRSQYADKEIVRLMKESGCEVVFLGIESGSDKILKNMNKGASVAEYLRGISLLKEGGIKTMGSFILGFPGETRETVQESVRFIEKSGIDFFRIHLWYCQSIAPIWKQRDKYNLKNKGFEWSHETMDVKEAAQLIYDVFVTIEEPLWIPQYDFEFYAIWNLMDRGLSMEQVKNFIRTFNRGVRQKIKDPSRKDVDIEVIKQFKSSLRTGNGAGEPSDAKKQGTTMDMDSVKFNF